jgi:two-component system capsular synthesis response regulator RcsB
MARSLPPPPASSGRGIAAPSSKRRDIIVADDHLVVILGLSKIFESQPNMHLVAAATSISELMQALQQLPCDVLVCDYSFEKDDDPDGLQLIERIARLHPSVKIVLLTAHDDIVVVQQAMRLGVTGFVSKASGAFAMLPSVIETVMGGKTYLDPNTSQTLVEHMLTNSAPNGTLAAVQLSARELEVMRLFANGMTVTEIAQYTKRSLKTISTQKKKAMMKLGAQNDVSLVNAFNRLR